jgi:5'-3' exonuclease
VSCAVAGPNKLLKPLQNGFFQNFGGNLTRNASRRAELSLRRCGEDSSSVIAMGVAHLLGLLRNVSLGTPNTAEDFRDKTLGVDISVWIHLSLSYVASARQFHVRPPIPLTAVKQTIKKYAAAWQRAGATLVFVFDGRDHPMKLASQERVTKRLALEEELQKLIADADPSDRARVEQLWKLTVYVREDVVALVLELACEMNIGCVGSPFEADWQLVHLERQGIIDAIITVDSDLIVLGGQDIAFRCNDKAQFIRYQQTDAEVRGILERELGSACTADDLIFFSSFLGNDYIHSPYSCGLAWVRSIIKSWLTATPQRRDAMLTGYEQLPKDDTGVKYKGYAAQFKQSVALFKYSPVLHVVATADNDTRTPKELFAAGDYTVELRPLNVLHGVDTTAEVQQHRRRQPVVDYRVLNSGATSQEVVE